MRLLRRMLLFGCCCVAFLILVIIIGGAFLPSRWNVQATATSAHSPQTLWPLICDFERWEEWSAWDDDAYGERTTRFEGEPATVGHSYSWSSNGSRGTLTLTRAQENVGIWYRGAIESDTPNAEGSITLKILADGRTSIEWIDGGDLPPLTGLLALWMNSSLKAKFVEDLHRLSAMESSESSGR
ncbi:MAG: SRPBCC family protein [Planctomycetota bacterium]|nr:SRPBCC family protein [Planctomycetota bacterium]